MLHFPGSSACKFIVLRFVGVDTELVHGVQLINRDKPLLAAMLRSNVTCELDELLSS